MDRKLYKRPPWIKRALFVSLLSNLFLLAVISYFALRESRLQMLFPFQPHHEIMPKIRLPQSVVEKYSAQNFMQLVEALKDKSPVIEGVLQRDIALSFLIHQQGFAAQRALGFTPHQKEYQGNFLLCGNLLDKDFDRLISFAEKERYPFVFSKLVEVLKQQPHSQELIEVVGHTPEFAVFKTLSLRRPHPVDQLFLIRLLVEGGAQPVSQLYEEMKKTASFDKEAWERLLVRFVREEAKTAAYLLVVEGEQTWVALPDELKLQMVKLMDEKTMEALGFVQKILEKEESAVALREAALLRYAQFTHQTPQEVAARFYQRRVKSIGE